MTILHQHGVDQDETTTDRPQEAVDPARAARGTSRWVTASVRSSGWGLVVVGAVLVTASTRTPVLVLAGVAAYGLAVPVLRSPRAGTRCSQIRPVERRGRGVLRRVALALGVTAAAVTAALASMSIHSLLGGMGASTCGSVVLPRTGSAPAGTFSAHLLCSMGLRHQQVAGFGQAAIVLVAFGLSRRRRRPVAAPAGPGEPALAGPAQPDGPTSRPLRPPVAVIVALGVALLGGGISAASTQRRVLAEQRLTRIAEAVPAARSVCGDAKAWSTSITDSGRQRGVALAAVADPAGKKAVAIGLTEDVQAATRRVVDQLTQLRSGYVSVAGVPEAIGLIVTVFQTTLPQLDVIVGHAKALPTDSLVHFTDASRRLGDELRRVRTRVALGGVRRAAGSPSTASALFTFDQAPECAGIL